MVSLLHELPLNKPKLLVLFTLIATAAGIYSDFTVDTRLDDVFHDAALVSHARKEWRHVAIIALDPKIPGSVSRRQTLPLFALAAMRAIDAGATVVFLDGVLYESAPNMVYAECIERFHEGAIPHQVRWSATPDSTAFSVFSREHFDNFYMAKPAFSAEDPFEVTILLQAYFGNELLPLDFADPDTNAKQQRRLFADASLFQKDNLFLPGVFRWMHVSENSVITKLALHHKQKLGLQIPHSSAVYETCNTRPCQRLLFSTPEHHLHRSVEKPLLPLSEFAACENTKNTERLLPYKTMLQNRVVILQLTEPGESTDLKLTPMATAIGSPHQLTPGSQFLADGVETALRGDQPRRPEIWYRVTLILIISLLSVLTTAFVRTYIAFLWPLLAVCISGGLCFVTNEAFLWPVFSSTLASVTGCLLVLLAHLGLGTARGRLVARYLPPPVRSMLVNLNGSRQFINQRRQAVVLMSDLAGYTTVTTELKEPEYVFDLINQYFEATTVMLQEKYHGWLEGYVGDQVCFYWPADDTHPLPDQIRQCLSGAIEQARRQQRFFTSLKDGIRLPVSRQQLEKISNVIGAGIGITTGELVMGNLGPESGVQKFGCLGDPLNLAARIEGLTRHFDTEIIITEELVEPALSLGLKTRKLVTAEVKGRPVPVTIYALGEASDPRFSDEVIQDWESWVTDFMQDHTTRVTPPEILKDKDRKTFQQWYNQGLLDTPRNVFVLKEK